ERTRRKLRKEDGRESESFVRSLRGAYPANSEWRAVRSVLLCGYGLSSPADRRRRRRRRKSVSICGRKTGSLGSSGFLARRGTPRDEYSPRPFGEEDRHRQSAACTLRPGRGGGAETCWSIRSHCRSPGAGRKRLAGGTVRGVRQRTGRVRGVRARHRTG